MKRIAIFAARSSFLCFLLIFSFTCAFANSLTDQLQKALDDAIANDESTPGAVLLVSSPKINTITVASGFADKAAKIPMKIDNNFRLASITKTFVAVITLKLSEKGVLNLDDKIADLVPDNIDIERIPNGKEVTVRQLLWMRSGIPNYLDYDGYSEKVKENPDLLWTPKDGIEVIYDEKPNFAPGKKYEYSNTNYLLLESIIEQATGKSFATLLHQYILDPLNLKNTYLELHETREGGYRGLKTHGYELDDGKLEDVTTYNDGLGLGDGGIVSTAQDLATFIKALLQTKTLLSADLLKQMLAPKGDENYGLGIYSEEIGDQLIWTHNGTSSGFATQFYYIPDKQLTIIILTNSSEADFIESLATKAFKIITKETRVVAKSEPRPSGSVRTYSQCNLYH